MEYFNPFFNELVRKKYTVYVYTNVKKRKTPMPKFGDNVHIVDSGEINLYTLKMNINILNPAIIYISGWMDLKYLMVVFLLKSLKKNNPKIIVGFDDQWRWSLKQIVGWILGRIRFMKLFFDYAWISGPYQFEYAKNMGFTNKEIIYDLLVGNSKFSQGERRKKFDCTKKIFLYAGRFSSEKGIFVLLEAWKRASIDLSDWMLVMVGSGSDEIKSKIDGFLIDSKKIEIYDFMNHDDLVKLFERAACGILPSKSEQWGVVLHEYCLAGLPVICSDEVGANPIFLIDGFNGCNFKSNNSESLYNEIMFIAKSDKYLLEEYGSNSRKLAERITIDTSLLNFLSVLGRS